MNKKLFPITLLALTLCVGVARADSTLEEVESIALDDNTSFTRTADCVAKKFTYTRSNLSAGWETLCLPVTFPVSELGTEKVYTLVVAPGIDDDYTVTLSRVDTIKAGYPYAIDNTDGNLTVLSVELENVTVSKASSTSTISFAPGRGYSFQSDYPYRFFGVYTTKSYSTGDENETPIVPVSAKARRSNSSTATYKYYYTLNSKGKFEYSKTVMVSPYHAVFRINCFTTQLANVDTVNVRLHEPLLALYGDASSTSHSDTLFVANVIRYDSSTDAWSADSIKMADAEAFNAVADFTANQFDYSRAVTTGNMFTFALPISCTLSQFGINEVYQFTAIEDNGGTLRFTKATAIEANKPYLIPSASGTDFAVTAASVSGTATATTLGSMATTVRGVSHIATLATTETVTSGTDGYNYYGYTGGKYVKAKTSTLKPWRTMFRVGSSSGAKQSFSVKLDDEVTGIVHAEADCSLVSALVDVYTIGGTRIRSQVSSLTALQGLPNGIYVVGGQKVVKK